MYVDDVSVIPKKNQRVSIMYDCCQKLHMLMWKDADKNFKKNNGRHVCRPCWLRTDNPARKKEVIEKAKSTCLERYGTEMPMNTPENVQARNAKIFGDAEAFASWIEKHRQTSQKRYGTDSPMQAEVVKQKQQATMILNHGVPVPLQSNAIMEKFRQTCRERYGCDYPLQSLTVKANIAIRVLERFTEQQNENGSK